MLASKFATRLFLTLVASAFLVMLVKLAPDGLEATRALFWYP